MSQTFYVAVNGQQTGPFSFEELKAKSIQRDTLIWTEGFDNWTKAGDVPLLKDILKAIPPPLPNQERKIEASPPPIVTPLEPTGKYFGYELAGRRDRFFAALMQAIVLLIPYLIIFGVSSDPDSTYSAGRIIGVTIFDAILGAFFYSIWSGNLGHKIMGLKVISTVDGTDKQNAVAGAVREAVKHLTSLFILPVIWLLWDDDRQNLYDKLVKTYVVKKKVGGVKSFFRGCFVFVFTIIFIICLVIFGSGYFFYAGVPALSNFIVSGVPKSLDKEVGKEARKELVRRASIDEKKSELLQEFYDELNYNTRTKVFVVRESEFNAFALPDNSIFVFDKVFEDLDDYTELAALLGHEYTHISKRHSMKILANALTRELIAEILTGGDNSDNFVRNANKLLVLSNSRAFETEADLGGLSLLREHNIDPSGMSKLFRIMLKLPQESEKETPSFLSTHPDTEDRLDEVDEAIKAKPSDAKPHDKLELIFKELKTLEDDHSF